VVANILAPVIVRLFADGLGELLAPHGYLVLSGILQEQAGEVIAAAQARGLRLVDRRNQGDWVALAFNTSQDQVS
jgi:ribosomal protein L11 methyltransferase